MTLADFGAYTAIQSEIEAIGLNASRPIAKGDLKWRDALLVAHRVNQCH